jgi:hypothetical protein
MTRKLIISVLTAAVLAAGCASHRHGHGGELVAEYRPGEEPPTTRTPYQATYALYQWHTPPTEPPPHTWIPDQEVTELYVRGLDRWEDIGFKKEENAGLVAVAGKEKIALENGHYCWHITPQSEYHGAQRILHEAGDNVLTVITLPFATACFIVVAPLVMVWGGLMMLGG